MRRIEGLHYVMIAVMMMSMLMTTACSEGNGEVEKPTDSPKPETPVSDGDWQVVPTTGGTISKDSISITFPSGTYDENSEVAIRNIKKGEIIGKYEVSPFYQITMPCTSKKPITIKIKCNKYDDNNIIVVYSKAYCMSQRTLKTEEQQYETTYSNGVYSATIPAIMGDVKENASFTIGLGHVDQDNVGTRGLRYKILFKGKVKNINYQIRYKWTLLEQLSWYAVGDYTFDKVIGISDKVHDYVKQAITIIYDLGFRVDAGKTLYIDFDKNASNWGGYTIYPIPGIENGWNQWVSLGTKDLLDSKTSDEDIKTTIIHEIFHWVQSFYDPRSNWSKASGAKEELTMTEMGAVWIENLINGGQLRPKWLVETVFNDIVIDDKLALKDTQERMGQLYDFQGYSMATLLYYLCSTKEFTSFGFKKESVLELHEQWKNSFDSNAIQTKTTFEIMEEWASGTHGCGIFKGDQIDKYYLKLLSGELVKDVEMFAFYDFYRQRKNIITVKNDSDKIEPSDGFVYPYGCIVRTLNFRGLKDITLNDKELFITQECEGMQTYLLTANRSSKEIKYERIGTVAKGKDPIIVSGDKLESLRQSDGSFDQYFFLITTRTSNSPSDTGKKPSKLTVELKSVNVAITPHKMAFETGGGTMSANVNGYGFKHIKCETAPSWLTVVVDEKDKSVVITAKPNLTGQERTGTVNCYVTNVDKPTEKDKIYLPVTVTQDGKLPSVSPSPLIFEAEGGMQTLNIKKQGFSYSKCIISNADKSWLSQKYNEGTYEVTAQPNTTGKERKTTIKCYVTNAQNGTDENTFYMDVEVTQKANDIPTVIPTSLTYEAEGGMQTLTIKVQGYKYCGCIIDDDAKSWLSKNYVSGGLYEVTAEPNTTNKERTTTIRCYVANEKNAPDDKRIYMEVQVAQMAGKEQTGYGNYEFVEGSFELNVRVNTWSHAWDSMGSVYLKATDKYLAVTPNGKGLHFEFNIDINEKGYSEKIKGQFDIDDLTLMDSQKSSVTNISWQRETYNTGGWSWGGTWGWDGMILSQTQKMHFSTNSKIPQTSFEYGGENVMWYAGLDEFEPTGYSFVRTSILDAGDGKTEPYVETATELIGDSSINVYLHFKNKAESR